MFLPVLLDYLKNKKSELESQGYIATLELAIEDIEDKLKYPDTFTSDKQAETHEQGYQPEKN